MRCKHIVVLPLPYGPITRSTKPSLAEKSSPVAEGTYILSLSLACITVLVSSKVIWRWVRLLYESTKSLQIRSASFVLLLLSGNRVSTVNFLFLSRYTDLFFSSHAQPTSHTLPPPLYLVLVALARVNDACIRTFTTWAIHLSTLIYLPNESFMAPSLMFTFSAS